MASPHLSLIRENRRSEAPLCGTVKIAGTKRDRSFSSGKKYLEVKAGSGKPGKTCTPLWTRSIDAREQGQVFWLVSPRAVFPPPEGDSDCSDRPTHGKGLIAAGTAPDSEHGSSPDSPRRNATLTRRDKVKHFFLSDNLFDDRFSSARRNAGTRERSPEQQGTRSPGMPGLRRAEPLHHYHATPSPLIYSIVPFCRPYYRIRSLPSPSRSAGANPYPCPTPQQASADNSRPDLPAPYGRLRRRKPPEPRRNERRTGRKRESTDQTKAASPGEACRFRQGRTRPVHIFTYRTRAARSGRTRHSGYPAAECPRYRPRGSRAYSRRCGTTRSAYRFC